MTEEGLARAALALRNAALPEWQMFITELAFRKMSAVEDCAAAGIDAVARCQGRALELKALLVLLQDADKTVAKYEQLRRRN